MATMEKDQAVAAARQVVFDKVRKSLNKRGVTFDRTARRLREALDATEVVTKFNGGLGGSQRFIYSKRLVAHTIRLQGAKLAAQLLGMEPAEKHEFPDETGKPQQIGALFCDTERAARLIWLLEQAEKRGKKKEGKCKPKP